MNTLFECEGAPLADDKCMFVRTQNDFFSLTQGISKVLAQGIVEFWPKDLLVTMVPEMGRPPQGLHEEDGLQRRPQVSSLDTPLAHHKPTLR